MARLTGYKYPHLAAIISDQGIMVRGDVTAYNNAISRLAAFEDNNQPPEEQAAMITEIARLHNSMPCEHWLAPTTEENPAEWGECKLCRDCGFYNENEADVIRQLRAHAEMDNAAYRSLSNLYELDVGTLSKDLENLHEMFDSALDLVDQQRDELRRKDELINELRKQQRAAYVKLNQ